MAEKNPFATLGFAPSAFQGLLEEEIRSLVKVQYRALAALYHPDHSGGSGGRSERFKEVQEAFDKLEQDFEFQFWKDLFVRPRKDHLAELRNERDVAQRLAQVAQGGLTAFWVAYCRGRELVYPTWPLGFDQRPKRSEQLEGFSVFNPPPLSIVMMDMFERMFFKVRSAGAWSDEVINPFELRLSSDWGMMRQNLVKTHFDPREKWRPPVRNEWINFRSPPVIAKSYYWKIEGEPVVVKGKLLGSIPDKILTEAHQRERHPAIQALISGEVSEGPLQCLERGYTLNEFEGVLPFIRPHVERCHWAITAEDDDDHTLRFKILGYVTKILPLEESGSSTSSVVGETATP